MSDSRWHILGAGSIGGLWAARLFQAGRKPCLILRPEHLANYNAFGGIEVEGEGCFPVEAKTSASLTEPVDKLLICCKCHQTMDALESISQMIGPDTHLLLVQNGLGVAELIRQRFPSNPVFLGTTTNGAYRTGPFHIIPAGQGETLIGSFDQDSTIAEEHAATLSCPTFPVSVRTPILPILWLKLAMNCAINPLTVRYRCRNGELLQIERARLDLLDICDEFITVSKALGRQKWIPDLAQKVMAAAERTGQNRSSMLQDIEAHRPTEIDFITGHLCRLADEIGLDIPTNRALYQEIRAISDNF